MSKDGLAPDWTGLLVALVGYARAFMVAASLASQIYWSGGVTVVIALRCA